MLERLRSLFGASVPFATFHNIKNYNFESFLTNLDSYKNLIYTYSDIEKPLINKDKKIINEHIKMTFKEENIKIIDINKGNINDFFLKNKNRRKDIY